MDVSTYLDALSQVHFSTLTPLYWALMTFLVAMGVMIMGMGETTYVVPEIEPTVDSYILEERVLPWVAEAEAALANMTIQAELETLSLLVFGPPPVYCAHRDGLVPVPVVTGYRGRRLLRSFA